MKKTTCVFGWKETTQNKEQHANNIRRLNKIANHKSGGVRPLSRMHPAHPARHSNALDRMEIVSSTQKFAP